MVARRIASQVHKQVGRLLWAGYLKEEPAWYQAVLQHPPLPLPARSPSGRTTFDKDKSKNPDGRHESRPLDVYYVEDRIRRQFFKDHPFEAFRPRTLVEEGRIEDEHPVRGEAWTRLRQRSRNPSPEDAIRFARNLYEHHNVSLSNAYSAAVSQYRALRSEHHLMSTFAAQEAEAYGAVFGPTPTERLFEAETNIRDRSLLRQRIAAQQNRLALKRWRSVLDRAGPTGEWSKGREYVRLWREGTRPNYERSLTADLDVGPSAVEQQRSQIDQMAAHVKA